MKYNSPVDIFYGEAIDSENQFQWTNIFLSLESRQEFIESWQSIKDKQGNSSNAIRAVNLPALKNVSSL